MAYGFNGTSQYLNFTASPAVNIRPMTLSAIAYSTSNTVQQCIFTFHGAGIDTFTLNYRADRTGDPATLDVRTDTATKIAIADTDTVNANQWAYLAGSMASGGTASDIKLYFNGNGNTTVNANVNTPVSLVTVANGFIGSTNVPSQYFSGNICECAAWSVALSDAELNALSKGFKPYRIRPQSLVFYAPLVRNLVDLSKNRRTITNNNTATVANHPRVY